MYVTGRIRQIVKEKESCNVHIFGVSEMRWTDSGIYSDETICCSGCTHSQHQEGVGMITEKKIIG